MNRRLALTVGLCALASARIAAAQTGEVTIGYQGLPNKPAAETPNGIQVADGIMMHVGAGAESGYDSNVFYQDTGKISSGILRASAYASIGNATRTGPAAGGLSFGAGAGLLYRRYLSDNPAVDKFRDAFMPSANLALGGSSGQLAFAVTDVFIRVEDAPYDPRQLPYARDNNVASAEVRWSPGGGRISTTLRYSNIIDILENQLSYANSLGHQLLLDVSWKWLPKTAIFITASQGYVTYLEPQPAYQNGGKVDSFPLRVYAGLRGLITPRVASLLAFGYANAFYASGESTSGFLGSTYAQAQVTITPTLLSRVIVGYRHDFVNSVISNFYYDDAIYASYVQQLAGRFAIDLSGRYAFKRYEGYLVPGPGGVGMEAPRNDQSLTIGATLDYFVRNWAYAGVGYSAIGNFSDATLAGAPLPGGGTGPALSLDYFKQQVFVRLGVTY